VFLGSVKHFVKRVSFAFKEKHYVSNAFPPNIWTRYKKLENQEYFFNNRK